MYHYTCTFCHKPFDSEEKILNRKTRCPECEAKVQKATEKRKQTSLEKYGVENVAQLPEIKDKYLNTWKERYGYVGYFQSGVDQTEIQERAHNDLAYERKVATNNKKFGTDYPAQNPEIQKKMQDTYEERTGYRNAMKNPEDRSKCKSGKYFYKNINFDSSWELAYYIWLTDNNVGFIYHPPYTLDYIDDYGKERTYYPDFLVEGKFYEIKGGQFFNEKGEPYDSYNNVTWYNKYNLLLENKITIMKWDDIRPYIRYVKDTYGKKYLNSFKRKKNKKGSETIEMSKEDKVE